MAPIHPKLAGASIGTNLSVVLLWVLHEYAHVAMPAEVNVAAAGLIAALFAWLARSN